MSILFPSHCVFKSINKNLNLDNFILQALNWSDNLFNLIIIFWTQCRNLLPNSLSKSSRKNCLGEARLSVLKSSPSQHAILLISKLNQSIWFCLWHQAKGVIPLVQMMSVPSGHSDNGSNNISKHSSTLAMPNKPQLIANSTQLLFF